MRGKVPETYTYVIVFTSKGPLFVTGTGDKNTAYWEKYKKPLSFSKDYARQMALGLTWNGTLAYAVSSNYEIVSHPYNYEEYEIEWRKKDV